MKYIFPIVILCLLFSLSACTPNTKLKGLVSGQGIVMYEGQPVEGATVSFSPSGEGRAAVGITDKAGKFVLMTLNPGDGLAPGEYKIIVTKIVDKVTPETKTSPSKSERTYFLPVKYADLNTTDLKVTIPPEGKNDIKLNLTGKIEATPTGLPQR
jgi:hypothetical protein